MDQAGHQITNRGRDAIVKLSQEHVRQFSIYLRVSCSIQLIMIMIMLWRITGEAFIANYLSLIQRNTVVFVMV
jgi:hypothetical protein